MPPSTPKSGVAASRRSTDRPAWLKTDSAHASVVPFSSLRWRRTTRARIRHRHVDDGVPFILGLIPGAAARVIIIPVIAIGRAAPRQCVISGADGRGGHARDRANGDPGAKG